MINDNPPAQIQIRFPTVRPIAMYLIIGILVAIQLYVMSLDNTRAGQVEVLRFYEKYSNNSTLVLGGEYYRLFTSMFLHGGLTHLIFNCWALYVFGNDIESLFGRERFLMVYFLGGLAGSLASVTFTRGNSIGASGAVFAVFGALIIYYYRNRKLYGQVAWSRLRQLSTVAIINLAFGLLSTVPSSGVRIDNAAHIGGMVGGMMVAWYLTPIFILQREGFHAELVDKQPTLQRQVAPLGFILLLALWLMLIIPPA